jgi:hypothetical protein
LRYRPNFFLLDSITKMTQFATFHTSDINT